MLKKLSVKTLRLSMCNKLYHPALTQTNTINYLLGLITSMLISLINFSCFCQTHKAQYEDKCGQKTYAVYVSLIVKSKQISISYGDSPFFKNMPIIKRVSKYYILTRDRESQQTDFWIFQSKYKIVRIWSNQRTGRLGRITYIPIR